MSTTLIEGLCFGEGPRWHEGALWLSDMHAREVLRITPDGTRETVVEVPGWPSGLGWLPDGDLLIVSMTERRVLRYDGSALTVHAELGDLATFHCNDMVVDGSGRAWVGHFGFDIFTQGTERRLASLIRIDPDGTTSLAADELAFPNGTVITPDGRTLIVGETMGACLTAFDVEDDGSLVNRREWAALRGAVPDGICLDADMGIWVASPRSNEVLRVLEGGEVTHRIATDRGAFACMLGGDDGRTLFTLTSGSSIPEQCAEERSAAVVTDRVDVPRAGWP